MYFLLWCLFEMLPFSSGETCTGPSDSASENQYECWNTNGVIKYVQFPMCVEQTQRCDSRQECDCPWCDDEWNCPTFEECQANGGFLCTNSYLESNQLWACIPGEWLCDGIWDCPSGEDEGKNACDVGKCADNKNMTYWYQCSDTGRCIDILLVGNGENDCVNGEDETLRIIEFVESYLKTNNPEPPIKQNTTTTMILQGTTTTMLQGTTTTIKATIEALYGIDLLMNVLGVEFEDVCSDIDSRFDSLEIALAEALQLNSAQVSSMCQSDGQTPLPESRRMWQYSSDSDYDEDEDESQDESEDSYSFVQVIVRLTFDDKKAYFTILQQILKYVSDFYESESSSDSIEEEFEKSMEDFDDEIGVYLSDTLRQLVRVETRRVSGNT